jgi:hypothetical protein
MAKKVKKCGKSFAAKVKSTLCGLPLWRLARCVLNNPQKVE